MNLKSLFTKKTTPPAPAARAESAVTGKLELAALDDCVGGRAETNGVGCYLRSDQVRAH